MAVPVNYSSITPTGAFIDQANDLPETTRAILRILPEIGNGDGDGEEPNGGGTDEYAFPQIALMLDEDDYVLPEYARLNYTTYKNGPEVDFGGIPAVLGLQVGALDALTGAPAYLDLVIQPATALTNLSSLRLTYASSFPSVWKKRNLPSLSA